MACSGFPGETFETIKYLLNVFEEYLGISDKHFTPPASMPQIIKIGYIISQI